MPPRLLGPILLRNLEVARGFPWGSPILSALAGGRGRKSANKEGHGPPYRSYPIAVPPIKQILEEKSQLVWRSGTRYGSQEEKMIPQELFGRIDLIVAGLVVAALFITFLIEIPDIARYFKIKSM